MSENPNNAQYTENEIRSLDWKEHIRLRPGMYIGKLGDGKSPDDGIYVLIKEVIDNSIDEHVMGHGKRIDVKIDEKTVMIRDYGRGIPLGKVIDCVSKINTGGKYDSRAFQKSVGLNGVGTKAVNALSTYFKVESSQMMLKKQTPRKETVHELRSNQMQPFLRITVLSRILSANRLRIIPTSIVN